MLHTSQVCDNHPVTATASAGQSRIGLVDFMRHDDDGGGGVCVVVLFGKSRGWFVAKRVV